MLLGTATWDEGPAVRRALVARLDSGRLADLSRIEALRLRKLGEGDPERLAEVLVPASLRRLLDGGPRALARARQTVAYAEKWDRRGTLPEFLAPTASAVARPAAEAARRPTRSPGRTTNAGADAGSRGSARSSGVLGA